MRLSRRPTTRLAAELLEDRSTPAVLTVTTANDTGPGSLRAAFAQAQADAAPDTIVFAPSVAGATINLSSIGDTSIGPSALLVTTPVAIRGSGQTISRVQGAPYFRLFAIGSTGSLTLMGLTLSNGLAAGGSSGTGGAGAGLGGAIYNQGALQILDCTLTGNQAVGGHTAGAAGAASGGGGLGGDGDSAGNGGPPNGGAGGGASGGNGQFGGGGGAGTAIGGGGGFGGGGGAAPGAGGTGGAGGFGGGGGTAPSGGAGGFGGAAGTGGFGGGGAGLGGAIFNQGGSVLIANSTLAANTARGGGASYFKATGNDGSGYGGGLFNLNGQVTLTNDTFAGNIVSAGSSGLFQTNGFADGGAVYNLSLAAPSFPGGPPATATQTATVTLANTILANSTGGADLANRQIDGTATIRATGPNLVSMPVVNTGGTVAGTPVTVAAPVLGPLASNGGPTQTILPQAGSPAIGAGSTTVLTPANFGGTAPAYDQRGLGYARVVRGAVDIGAAEVQLPRPLAVSGPPDGTTSLFAPDASGTYSSPTAVVAPFPGFAGSTRSVMADVDGDGIPDTVVVTGPGTPIRVAVVSGADNKTLLVAPFDPFGGNFTGGGFVAAADLDGSGKAVLVVTPDRGGGPRVVVFSVAAGAVTMRATFFGINDQNFRGGARAALGDVNGDGTPDLVVAAGFGGGPRVAIFDGTTILSSTPTRLVNDFFAFPGSDAITLRNGVFVAAGDVNGDGLADLIFGGGPGGAPRVFILSGALVAGNNVAGAQNAPIANFFVAGNVADRGGVRVAAVNADGDSKADVAVGSGEGDAARVRVYLGKNFTSSSEPGTFQDLITFGGTILPDGVYVG